MSATGGPGSKGRGLIDRWRQLGTSGVIACSALRRSYRDFLTDGRPDVRLVYSRGDTDAAASRLAARKGHFRPPSLRRPIGASWKSPDPDENSIHVDVKGPIEDVVADIMRRTRSQLPADRWIVAARAEELASNGAQWTDSSIVAVPNGAMETSRSTDSPLAIEDYALIGDCTTAASLAATAPSTGCAGRVSTATPVSRPARHDRTWTMAHLPSRPEPRVSRAYRDGTMVLETIFETADGRVALIDFMPIGQANSSIIRLVKGQRGKVAMRLHLTLRFDYGATVPWVTQLEDESGLSAMAGPSRVVLRTPVVLQGKNFATIAEFDVARRASACRSC